MAADPTPDREHDGGPRVFMSYASTDRDDMTALVDGLESLGADVWLDRALVGGRAWWDEILRQIRRCDVFVQAISPAGIESEACARERAYAAALGKPTLPVLVAAVDMHLLSDDLARLQIVRYIDPKYDDAFRLARALANCGPAPPLPDPLPEPPEVPVSYLHSLRDKVRASSLTQDEQLALIARLEGALEDDEERDGALNLLGKLAERDDLYEISARKIERLIGPTGGDEGGDTLLEPPPPPRRPRPAAVAAYVLLAAALAGLAGGALREATNPEDAEKSAEIVALVFARTIAWALIVAAVSAVIARPAPWRGPAIRGLFAGAVSGLAGGLVHGLLQYGAESDAGISRLAGLAVTGAIAGAFLGRWLRAPAAGFMGGLVGGLAAGLLVLDWPGPNAEHAVSATSWVVHAVPICLGAVGLAMLLRRRPAPVPEPVAPPVRTAV